MKKFLFIVLAVITIVCLTACGTKQEIVPGEKVTNDLPTETTVNTPVKSEEEVAKQSLIDGAEWKPTTGYKQNSGEEIVEYSVTDIYGKYGGVGGATFHEDGTFTKFVGVFEGEEEADKTGTYTINTEEHTITLNYSKGAVVTLEYDHSNDGKVLYFLYPENEISVRFESMNTISLKDNDIESKYQIELAMKNLINEMYGSKIVDSKVKVEKIYSPSEEQENEPLREMNLDSNEVAFELTYEIKPAEGEDANSLITATGEYDEASGWIKNIFLLGVLRPNSEGDAKYIITDYGTGW